MFGLANGNASNATIVSVAGAAGEAELRRVISTATALVVLTTGFMALCVSLAADFLATNTAFPALVLSDQYAAATTDEDRALALAAGQAMFALFNENAFLVSYVLVSAAWMLIAAVMLRSAVFSRITACAGILAGGSGIVAVALEHIAGGGRLRAVAIAVYFAAIVFLFIWVVLTGRRLYRLGGPNAVAEP